MPKIPSTPKMPITSSIMKNDNFQTPNQATINMDEDTYQFVRVMYNPQKANQILEGARNITNGSVSKLKRVQKAILANKKKRERRIELKKIRSLAGKYSADIKKGYIGTFDEWKRKNNLNNNTFSQDSESNSPAILHIDKEMIQNLRAFSPVENNTGSSSETTVLEPMNNIRINFWDLDRENGNGRNTNNRRNDVNNSNNHRNITVAAK